MNVPTLNSVLLEGVILETPVAEMRPVSGYYEEQLFLPLKVQTTRMYKGQGDEIVTEHSVFEAEVWCKLAKNNYTKLFKGVVIRSVGRLKQVRWHDAHLGEQSKVVVVLETIEYPAAPVVDPDHMDDVFDEELPVGEEG